MYNYYNKSDYAGMHDDSNYMMPAKAKSYNQNLINSYDGFIRGNMFAELYRPYITGEPFNLMPQNEREDLLNKVREFGFAMIDLDLYLDTHPDDVEKIKVYNQYLIQEKQATDEYEKRYGPLSLGSDVLNSYPWTWASTPWPWEVM
jgi:spore coat protein JB